MRCLKRQLACFFLPQSFSTLNNCYFEMEQRLGWGWQDLAFFSHSWESSFSLTRDYLPWEMWVLSLLSSLFRFLFFCIFFKMTFDYHRLSLFPFRFSSLQGCLLLLVWSRPCNSLWNVRIIRFDLFSCSVHVWCSTIAPFSKLLVLLSLCRELSLLVLASSLLLSDGQFWEWFLRHMASLYSSGK